MWVATGLLDFGFWILLLCLQTRDETEDPRIDPGIRMRHRRCALHSQQSRFQSVVDLLNILQQILCSPRDFGENSKAIIRAESQGIIIGGPEVLPHVDFGPVVVRQESRDFDNY